MKQNHKKYFILFLLSIMIVPFQNCGVFKAGVSLKGATDSASLADAVPATPGTGTVTPPGTGTTPVVPTLPPDPSDAGRRILKVCASGCAYSTPSSAISASADNDIIEIQAGTYNNCFGLTKNNIKIRGVNGRAHFSGTMCQGKGAIVFTGKNLVVENLEFSNFYVADQNGAGIRHQGTGLIVRNSYFHDGENGILSESIAAPGSAEDTILIENSKFDRVGGGGGYAHAVYFGHAALVTVKNSLFLNAHQGHEFKSRAHANTIDCSVFASLSGDDSYSLNFPDAGNVLITNSTIEQGPSSTNSGIVDYGSEMTVTYPVQNFVANNIIVINDLGRGAFFNVRNTTKFEIKSSVFVGAGSAYGVQSAAETSVSKQADRIAANLASYPALPTASACTGTVGLLF